MDAKKVTISINGIGQLIALALSFATWGKIGWALLHGLLGWLYLVYYVFKYVIHVGA